MLEDKFREQVDIEISNQLGRDRQLWTKNPNYYDFSKQISAYREAMELSYKLSLSEVRDEMLIRKSLSEGSMTGAAKKTRKGIISFFKYMKYNLFYGAALKADAENEQHINGCDKVIEIIDNLLKNKLL